MPSLAETENQTWLSYWAGQHFLMRARLRGPGYKAELLEKEYWSRRFQTQRSALLKCLEETEKYKLIDLSETNEIN